MKMTALRNMTLSERYYHFEVFDAFFQVKNMWGEEAAISTKILICRLIRLRGSNRKNTLNLTDVVVTTCSFTSSEQP
jgi:hypothetical protein